MSAWLSYVITPFGVERVRVFDNKEQAALQSHKVDGEFAKVNVNPRAQRGDTLHVCVNEPSKENTIPIVSLHSDMREAKTICVLNELFFDMKAYVHSVKLE